MSSFIARAKLFTPTNSTNRPLVYNANITLPTSITNQTLLKVKAYNKINKTINTYTKTKLFKRHCDSRIVSNSFLWKHKSCDNHWLSLDDKNCDHYIIQNDNTNGESFNLMIINNNLKAKVMHNDKTIIMPVSANYMNHVVNGVGTAMQIGLTNSLNKVMIVDENDLNLIAPGTPHTIWDKKEVAGYYTKLLHSLYKINIRQSSTKIQNKIISRGILSKAINCKIGPLIVQETFITDENNCCVLVENNKIVAISYDSSGFFYETTSD